MNFPSNSESQMVYVPSIDKNISSTNQSKRASYAPQQKGAIYFQDEKTFSTILLQKYTHTLSCYPFFWLGFRWEFCFIHILHYPFLRFVNWWRQIWGGDLKKKMHYLSQKSFEIIPHNKLFLNVSIISFLKVERQVYSHK